MTTPNPTVRHPHVTASYDDHSVLLVIQATPDGPIGPIRLTPDDVLGLSVGLATAADAFQAHQRLIGAVDQAVFDAAKGRPR